MSRSPRHMRSRSADRAKPSTRGLDAWTVVRTTTRHAVAGFDSEGVAAALHAACSSPGAVHRLPSLAGLWVAFWGDPPSGQRASGSADLQRWVSRLRDAAPFYADNEDWLPPDPGLLVRVRHRGGLWPLHPGLFGWPSQVIWQVQRCAEAWDEQTVARFGFGFGDLIEVALRIIAGERQRIAPHWAKRRAAAAEDPPVVGEQEVAAAREWLAAWARPESAFGLPGVLLDPAVGAVDGEGDPEHASRLGRALRFATVDVREVVPAPTRTSHLVGALAVRAGDRVVPVPAALVLDGLAGSADRLLRALADDPDGGRPVEGREALAERLAVVSDRLVPDSAENLLAHAVPVVLTPGGARYWLLCPSARHLVVVTIATGVTSAQTERAVRRARRDLNRLAAGASMQTVGVAPTGPAMPAEHSIPVDRAVFEGGSGRVATDAAVTRVVLVDGPRRPRQMLRWNRGPVELTVDQWRYLTASAGDPEELWAFLDELSLLPGLDHVEAFDICDVWEAFRERGVLNQGGAKQPQVFVPPSDLDAQWRRAAQLDPLEEMLRGWGMGGVQLWPSCVVGEDGQVDLFSLMLFGHLIADPGNGFAVAAIDDDRRADHQYASLLVQAVHFTLHALATRAGQSKSPGDAVGGWAAWHAAVADEPLLVQLLAMPAGGDRFPARLGAVIPGERIVLAYDEQQLRRLDADQVHTWLGRAVADGILALTAQQSRAPGDASEIVDSRELVRQYPEAAAASKVFLAAWLSIPPPLRVYRFSGPSARATTVFAAVGPSDPARARAGRMVAREVVRRGVPAQRASGAAAIELLVELCQVAEAALARELSAFEGASAVRAAGDEVERVWELRSLNEQQRAIRVDLTAEQYAGQEVEESQTARAADLVLESLLHHPPTGTFRLDHRDWTRLVHLAAECLRLRDHLTAARCGLLTLDVALSSNGLIRSSYTSSLMDLPRHQQQRVESNAQWIASMLQDEPIQHDADGGDDNAFQSLRTLLEQTATGARAPRDRKRAELMLAIDNATYTQMGTSLDAINAVLMTVSAWPVPGDPFGLIAEVTIEQLVASAATWSGLDPELVRGAVRWLLLSPTLLAAEESPYWSLEGRNARLAVRPLIQPPATAHPETVIILPRRATGARRVHANYLLDGRLPSPASALPKPVAEALRAWRQHAEREFELEVERVFVAHGITHRRAALLPRKAAKHGLVLSRELDLLAADPVRRILWVVEAKDQHVPYGPNQLVHEVVDFHGVPDATAATIKALQAGPPEEAFVGKLLANAQQVRGQIEAALRLLGFNSSDAAQWRVEPLIVTSRPSPAAAVPEPRVTFTTPSSLPVILNQTKTN